MAGPQQTRHIGFALRIYKNSNNKLLGIDKIYIVADNRKIGDGVWHRSGRKEYKRILANLEITNRTVTTVWMIGDYSSITENSGDYLYATWADDTGNANDIKVTFNDLKKIGDIL